ncbi:MAG TPA: hypothetical protein VHM91_23800 [Verrucomicrobiales bacterium]|jgi:hypothetical protein|nr:hypothetical protein [Verrucomicrobiales bacterium]
MAHAEKILTYGAAGILVTSGSLLQFAGSQDRSAPRGIVSAVQSDMNLRSSENGERLLGRREVEWTLVAPEFPRPPACPGPSNLYRVNLPSNLMAGEYSNTKQVRVPAQVALLSKGAPATCSDPEPIGDLELVTDGEKNYEDGYCVDLIPGSQWVQIDLGETREVHLVWLWMGYKYATLSYKDILIRISDDPSFAQAETVFNNDHDNSSGMGAGTDPAWIETNFGHPVSVKGARGRYVRLYSNGKNLDETNQWIEVEVYGR